MGLAPQQSRMGWSPRQRRKLPVEHVWPNLNPHRRIFTFCRTKIIAIRCGCEQLKFFFLNLVPVRLQGISKLRFMFAVADFGSGSLAVLRLVPNWEIIDVQFGYGSSCADLFFSSLSVHVRTRSSKHWVRFGKKGLFDSIPSFRVRLLLWYGFVLKFRTFDERTYI